jgi:hypothetical protein
MIITVKGREVEVGGVECEKCGSREMPDEFGTSLFRCKNEACLYLSGSCSFFHNHTNAEASYLEARREYDAAEKTCAKAKKTLEKAEKLLAAQDRKKS